MNSKKSVSWERVLENIALVAVGLNLILVGLVMVKFALHAWPVPGLGAATMPPNPAGTMCAAAIAAAVIIRIGMSRGRGGVALGKALAVIVLLLSLIKIAGALLHVDVLFDHVLFASQMEGLSPNRLAFNAGISFACLSIAMLLQFFERLPKLADLLAFTAFLIVFLGAIGLEHGAKILTTFGYERPISITAIVGMALLSLGVVLARPTVGFSAVFADKGPAGTVARWLMPASFLTPFIVSSLYGFAPQYLQLPLVTLTCSVAFCFILAVAISKIHLTDRRRAQVEKSKQDFMLRTVHDLRSPANVIALLVRDFSESSSEIKNHPDTIRGMQIINELNDRMRSLVDDLNQVAKGEDVSRHLKTEPIAVAPLVDHLFKQHGAIAEGRHMRMEQVVPQTPREVLADREALIEVLENYIGNAIKYGREGGVIRVSQTCDDRFCTIKVWDDGMGISEKDIPKIFDAYFRVDGTGVPGTGLGLYIVQQLVENMGGKVLCKSSFGEWTEFSATLPVAKEQGQG